MQFLENVKLEPLGWVRVTCKLTSDWTFYPSLDYRVWTTDKRLKVRGLSHVISPEENKIVCCSDTELFATNNLFF